MQAIRSAETEQRARLFGALADPTRLEIVRLLADEPDLSTSRIAEACGVSLALACHHVKVLTDAGVVSRRKIGLRTHYELLPDSLTSAFDATLHPTALPEERAPAGSLRILAAYPVA